MQTLNAFGTLMFMSKKALLYDVGYYYDDCNHMTLNVRHLIHNRTDYCAFLSKANIGLKF